MFIALSFACFVLGFTAALAWVAQNGRSKDDGLAASQLLSRVANRLRDASQLLSQEQSSARRLSDDINPHSRLMTKEEVEATFEPSSWQRLAYEDFKATILANSTTLKTFPCIYATMGYRENGHRYVFTKSENPSEPQNIRIIGPALSHYLSIARGLGWNTSLVILSAPPDPNSSKPPKTVEDYNNDFWALLRGLRIQDPASWPEEIPHSTLDAKWTFCYDGVPIFPVQLTPAHTRRFSRHSSVPIIALQPKWILDKLLGTPEKRASATGKVRKLLTLYDSVDISPDLTGYGEEGTSEVRQLCLKDFNEQVDCPFENFDQ